MHGVEESPLYWGALHQYASLATPVAGIATVIALAWGLRLVASRADLRQSRLHACVNAVGFPLLVVAMLAIGIGWTSRELTVIERARAQAAAHANIAGIADLKARQLDEWLLERKGDARALGGDPRLAADFTAYRRSGDARERRAIEERLRTVKDAYGYERVAIVDARTAVRASTGDARIDRAAARAARCAIQSARVCVSDFHEAPDRAGGVRRVTFAAPLAAPGASAAGAVLLRVDPEKRLFPLVARWPAETDTAEAFLAAVDDRRVVHLTPLRHSDALPAEAAWRPKSDLLAVMAARGLDGAAEAVDYRDVAVIGAGRRLAEAPWVLVAKQDADEVYAPLHATERGLIAAAALIVVAFALTTFWWWRMHVVATRERLRAEEARAEMATRKLQYLSRYANDLVLLLDDEGRILECNDRAQEAYGYGREELVGSSMSRLRADGIAPEFKTGDGSRDGLVYEVSHKRKDGTVFPVEVSVRHIATPDGPLFQAIIRDVSERKRHEAKLRLDALVFDNARDAILITDASGTIISVNKAFTEVTGYERSEVIGRNPRILSSGRHDRAFYEALWRSVRTTGFWQGEIWNRKRNGEIFAERQTITAVYDAHGRVTNYVSVFNDITERRQAEDQLRFQAHVLDTVGEAIVATDGDGRITYWNRQAEELYGWTEAEARGCSLLALVPAAASRARVSEIFGEVQAGRNWTGELELVRRNGEDFIAFVTVSPMFEDGGRFGGFIAVGRDVTARKRDEERLAYLAQYDTLTGLPNRNLFRERLSQALTRADRSGRIVGLMFFDLDRFKQVNDTLGHGAGDALLQMIAQRLKDGLRQVDTVARLGGDEFTIVVEGASAREDIAAVARKVLQLFREPVCIDGTNVYVTASIGVTTYPADASDMDGLLKTADVAMYQAKSAGRNNFQFYSASRNAISSKALTVESELRQALDRGEFSLVYQPRVRAADLRVVSVEALLRWTNPRLGSMSPEEFIPIAEETGLIIPIGDWVLREACRQWKRWCETGPLSVSVNLSALQFQNPDSIPRLLAIVRDAGIEPSRLELEITETTVMRDAKESIRKLRQLREAGVKLSIDDFGTGYSSLGYLKRFPVDALKIDKSFVAEIRPDSDTAAIVRAVVSMAKHLGLNVVAEGIETAEQLRFLQGLHCDEYQGYYFSRPLAADEVPAYSNLSFVQRRQA